jgi:peptidoglycan/LPS O-acetylase OafA/YrhL
MWTYALTAIGLSLLGARFRLVLIAIVIAVPLALGLLGAEALGGHGWPLLRCLSGFSIGMLTFDLHARRQGGLGATGASLCEAAALLAAAAAIAWLARGPFLFVSPFLFGLAIFALAREEGAASRVLMRAPMRCLGRWSYSIYMVHALVLILVDNGVRLVAGRLGLHLETVAVLNGEAYRLIDGGGVATDLFALLSLAVVIAAASITYWLVELPFRNASRRLAERIAQRPLVAAERVAPTM